MCSSYKASTGELAKYYDKFLKRLICQPFNLIYILENPLIQEF